MAVIGGGNSGVEAAIDLAGLVQHVTLIEFDSALRADEVLQRKLRSLPNVTVIVSGLAILAFLLCYLIDEEGLRAVAASLLLGAFYFSGALALAWRWREAGLLQRFLALASMALALVVAGTAGRLLMLAVMWRVPALPGLGARVAKAMDGRRFGLALLFSAPVLLLGTWFAPGGMALALAVSAAFLIWYRALLVRRLGGSTGDAMGAAAYAGLVGTTLALGAW